jgi:hypothetical protein
MANLARSLGDAIISVVLHTSRPQSDSVDVTLSESVSDVRGRALSLFDPSGHAMQRLGQVNTASRMPCSDGEC